LFQGGAPDFSHGSPTDADRDDQAGVDSKQSIVKTYLLGHADRLKLVNTNWEQALVIILRLKGLRMLVDGNTRSVTARNEQQPD
jgi:hypothetical protein